MSIAELSIAIQNTLLVVVLCLLLALPMGTFLGIVLSRCHIALRQCAWLAIQSQLAIPLYVVAGGWSAGFGFQGWFSALGFQLSSVLGSGEAGSVGALLAVAWIHALAAVPWVMMVVALGAGHVDQALEDAALLDGGPRNLMWRVVLPRLWPWIGTAAALAIYPVLTEMVVTNLYQVPTVTEQVYLDASRGSLSGLTYVAAAIGAMIPLLALAFGIWLWLPPWSGLNYRVAGAIAKPLPLGRWRTWIATVTWGIVIFLAGVPLVGLAAKAGWMPFVDENGMTNYGWSMRRFMTTCYGSATLFTSEFGWSAAIALLSASLALGTTLLLHWFLRRRGMLAGHIVMLAIISVPGPLVGLFVIWLLNRSQPFWLGWLYDRTLAGPVLAQQFRLLPLAWLLSFAIFKSISQATREQAQIDGLKGLAWVRTVVLPTTKGMWVAAWVLLAVLSVGELSCSILVLPPGVTTVSMRLFEMLHFGMRHQDSGLCGLLVAVGWAASFVFWNTLSDRKRA